MAGSCEQDSAPSDFKNILTNKTTKKFLMKSLQDTVIYVCPSLVLRRETFHVRKHFCALLIFLNFLNAVKNTSIPVTVK
jgi:hypothetical protein